MSGQQTLIKRAYLLSDLNAEIALMLVNNALAKTPEDQALLEIKRALERS